jgi:hypothetical protein
MRVYGQNKTFYPTPAYYEVIIIPILNMQCGTK